MITNRLLYFVLYVIASPVREILKLIRRFKDLVNPPSTFLHKLNYPKAWMWFLIIWLIVYYIFSKRIDKLLIIGIVVVWIWKEHESGNWVHDYREQLKANNES